MDFPFHPRQTQRPMEDLWLHSLHTHRHPVLAGDLSSAFRYYSLSVMCVEKNINARSFVPTFVRSFVHFWNRCVCACVCV